MADFTKDGAQVDEWAQIVATAIRVGADIAIPDDIGVLLEITLAHDSANAHANGALVIVEVSSNTTGDEDWSELIPGGYRSDGATATLANVDQESSGTSLYVDATSGFITKFLLFFVKDATIANSEIGRVGSWNADDAIYPVDNLTNTHQNTADVFNKVFQWIVSVPKEFRRARVIIWNDDADCTICTRTRKALATNIE